MAKILVFCEHVNGKVKSASLELLGVAHQSSSEIVALALGNGSKSCAESLGAYGVKKVYFSESPSYTDYNSEAYFHAANEAIKAESVEIILGTGSSSARDFFPKIAAQLQAGFVADGVEIKIDGSNVSVKKPLYAGKCTAVAELNNSNIKVVLMRANQLPVPQPSSGTAELKEVSAPPSDLKTIVKEVVKGASTKLDLSEASVIVSGGRGMKGPEHFKLLNDLADVLGATVGASRAVVDAGWVPHSMQVGQTGKTVAPNLYIACGISGAIQHLAGMSSSKVIVAINKDPEAPIFKKATYGIVGDVFEVLPKLTEEFKKILQH